jgi:hypothetical protein
MYPLKRTDSQLLTVHCKHPPISSQKMAILTSKHSRQHHTHKAAMEACELGVPYDMCSDACSQDDREAWDNLSDLDTGGSTSQSQPQVRILHQSDTFRLKQGRCHTCLSRLPADETHELPSTSCLDKAGLNLGAQRCKSCFSVTQDFDHLVARLPILDPQNTREMWKHLQQAVALTHRRKKRNEDTILKAIEDDLDMEYAALKRMLEKCKPPRVANDRRKDKGKGKSNGSCSKGSRPMEVALGRHTPGQESLTAQLARLRIHDEGHSQR